MKALKWVQTGSLSQKRQHIRIRKKSRAFSNKALKTLWKRLGYKRSTPVQRVINVSCRDRQIRDRQTESGLNSSTSFNKFTAMIELLKYLLNQTGCIKFKC